MKVVVPQLFRIKTERQMAFNFQSKNSFTPISFSTTPHCVGLESCVIKSKGLDEMGILVCREAVPVEGEVGDLGHWPPERILNPKMTAAKSSATVATIFHCCANNPCINKE